MLAAMTVRRLEAHRQELLQCRACPNVHPPVVAGPPHVSPIYLLGQAPGPREGALGRPFAWTAGRTLFRWLATLGADEETFRSRAYIGAVLRCFPGKASGGGDRVPARDEIERCRPWIAREVELCEPELVIAVGRLAIEQVLSAKVERLEHVVGGVRPVHFHGRAVDVVALPHPSGLSAWPKIEPGKTLLASALTALGSHPAWRRTFRR